MAAEPRSHRAEEPVELTHYVVAAVVATTAGVIVIVIAIAAPLALVTGTVVVVVMARSGTGARSAWGEHYGVL